MKVIEVMMNSIDTEKEAKKRLVYLREFTNSKLPVIVIVKNIEELKVYQKAMKSMRKISNLELKVNTK